MAEQNLVYIPTAEIHPHPDNPRKDVGDVSELAASIAVNGILQNLTVVKGHAMTQAEREDLAHLIDNEENPALREIAERTMDSGWSADKYTVIIGHRRLAAAKLAGVTEVPCVVAELSHKEQVSTMLSENMQRTDLTVYEQAQGFQMMMDLGSSVEQIAKDAGFSPATVRRRVKLLELDKDKFKASEARGATLADYIALDRITDPERKNKVLEAAGTPNFQLELKQAIEEEELEARLNVWEAEIRKWAMKVEGQNKVGDRNVPMKWISGWNRWIGKDKAPEKPETEGTYYYARSKDAITVYQQLDIQSDREKKQEERERRARETEQHKLKLEEITERHYNLRRDFIMNFKAAKSRATDIMGFAARAFLENTVSRLDEEAIADCLGNDYASELERCPEYGLLVCAWASVDSTYRKYWGWNWNGLERTCCYQDSDTLDFVYNELGRLGYQMSDEEKAMQNGTHEIFKGRNDNGQ